MKVLFVGGTGKLGNELIKSQGFESFQIVSCSSRNLKLFKELIEKELASYDVVLFNSFDSKDDYFESIDHYEKASLAPLKVILKYSKELKISPRVVLISSVYALLKNGDFESAYVSTRKKTEAYFMEMVRTEDMSHSIVRRGIVISKGNVGLQKMTSAINKKLGVILNFPVEYGLPVTRLDLLISTLKESMLTRDNGVVNCIDLDSNLLDNSGLNGVNIRLNPRLLDCTFRIGHVLKLPWNKWYALKLKSFKQIINDSHC